MNLNSQRRINIVLGIIVIIAMIVAFAFVVNHPTAKAAEPALDATIIRTHEHMFMPMPNHVFMSKAEKCRIPSRKELARVTNTPISNWEKYLDNHRTIYYIGDGHTLVSIKIWKDQDLSVNSDTGFSKYYGFGDVYVGTGDFVFGCYHSRHRLFNPNVGRTLCKNGANRLEKISHRSWYVVYQNDPDDYPTSYYVYKKHRYMPGFFIPLGAAFIIESNKAPFIKTFQPGYLTPVIPHREWVGLKYEVRVETYC